MKKLFAVLSIAAFLAVNVNAQTSNVESAPSKKEATAVSKDAKKDAHGCCVKANTACCKNNKDASASKNCTPEQKAACAKAGKECEGHGKAKAKAMTSKEEPKVVAPNSAEATQGPLE